MSYSETTYYFFGARLTGEQCEVAYDIPANREGVQVMSLGNSWGGEVQHFLAVGVHEVVVDDEPRALDAMPVLSGPVLRALGIALEDLGVTEQPRWWLGVSGG